MSDIEGESDIEDFQEESSDEEEIIEVQDLPSEDISAPHTNKFMAILLTNMRYPSKFLAHSLVMARVQALYHNAKPLCSNPPPPGNDSADQILPKLAKIALQEVMEDKSPMMFDNPITKTQWSSNDLDKTLFHKIISEAIALAED